MAMQEQLLDFASDDQLAGFRLQRLEVLNWGTFNHHVWRLNLDGRNALLTGDIGSGKSTLVDAMTTLLVRPQRAAYNKAAGAESKERSLRSYVLGYYKSERSDTGPNARPVALRDHNSYSVILASFYNAGFDQTVTLAQLFWHKDQQGQPERIHIVAEQDLAIETDFANFNANINTLRKRLRDNPHIQIHDSFAKYEAAFRRLFGIDNDQALELFHQTVSMKSVGNLTGFVREHMLEAFDVGHSIPGATAGLIEGPDVQALYTGDIRFHGRSGLDLGDELRGLRPDVMLCEGTRITEDEPDDEQAVEDDLATVFTETDGLAMVGFAWKDLERYETVRLAAERAGRTPVFDPRLAYLAARLGTSVYDDGASVFVERSGDMLYSPGDYTRAKHKLGDLPVSEWDNSDGVTDTTHLERGTTATEIRRNPENYVLHLDYYRFKNLPDLDPPAGSTFVRAQTEPFNEGMELSEERLINWLEHFGINPDRGHEPIQIHASGHACGTEIQAMIDAIEPRVLVPIHTEAPGAFENEAGEVRTPEEGVPIDL